MTEDALTRAKQIKLRPSNEMIEKAICFIKTIIVWAMLIITAVALKWTLN